MQSKDKFVIRLPDGMRDRIKRAADEANRSMNSEIISTLERAYPPLPPKIVHSLTMVNEATLRLASASSTDEKESLRKAIERHSAVIRRWSKGESGEADERTSDQG